MRALTLRLQDFAQESEAQPVSDRTYSQAEVDTIRRQAFASGEREGRAAADATAGAATADHAAVLHRLTQDAAQVREEADALLCDALRQLETVVRTILAGLLPHAAAGPARDDLLAALREVAETVRLPEIALTASPHTIAALVETGPGLPHGIQGTADPAIADGEVRLAWRDGSAIAKADARAAAIAEAVCRSLGNRPPPTDAAGATGNSIEGSDSDE